MRHFVISATSVFCLIQVVNATPKNPDHTEQVIVYQNTQSFFDIAGWPDDGIYAEADIHIHQYPGRGEVRVNLPERGFIFYPDIDLCAADDEFIYSIKYGDWMETYRIKVEIVCSAPTIIAAFSPQGRNGDYKTFTILGVKTFANNTLSIFDRAGRPILKASEYENTWDGRLPDGTYARPEDEFLYVFDDGQGNLYSGYVKVE